MFVSFPILGKFSATISSNNFIGPLSLSSPSEITTVWMLLYLRLLLKFLKVSYLFIFSFCYSVWVNSTVFSYGSLFPSSTPFSVLLNPSCIFHYSYHLHLVLSYIFHPFVEVLICSCLILSISVSIFMMIILNFYQVDCLSLFCLVLFLSFTVFFQSEYSPLSPHFASFCVFISMN